MGSDHVRQGTTIKLTFEYLLKKQATGWLGSTSIHPRVVNGRTAFTKYNTCGNSKKK